jgi:hypothetical protein
MAIKPITADATVTVVWPHDPAVDADARITVKRTRIVDGEAEEWDDETTRVARYGELCVKDPGCWRDLLHMHPGQEPTEFVLGVIPPSRLNRIEDDARVGHADRRGRQLQWESFCAALVDMRNGPTQEIKKDGRVVHEVPKSQGRVDRAWLDDIFGGGLRVCALNIGSIAFMWNNMQTGDAKK